MVPRRRDEQQQEGPHDRPGAEQRRGDDHDRLLEIQHEGAEGEGDRDHDPDHPDQHGQIRVEEAEEPGDEGVAERSRRDRDRDHPEQIGEEREQQPHEEPHHPTRGGGQEAVAEQRLHRVRPEGQAEEEPVDRKEHEEQSVAAERHEAAQEQQDRPGYQAPEERAAVHMPSLRATGYADVGILPRRMGTNQRAALIRRGHVPPVGRMRLGVSRR
jgi:hypothetical protein